MDVKLDTLATSRKLEASGMPGPQAGAVVEIVNDAMTDFVTKEYLTVELDRSFSKFERKIDRKLDERFDKVDEKFDKIDEKFDKIDEKFERIDGKFDKIDGKFEKMGGKFEKVDANINELKLSIAELGKSQAWGFASMYGFTIAAGALLFAALQFFGP